MILTYLQKFVDIHSDIHTFAVAENIDDKLNCME